MNFPANELGALLGVITGALWAYWHARSRADSGQRFPRTIASIAGGLAGGLLSRLIQGATIFSANGLAAWLGASAMVALLALLFAHLGAVKGRKARDARARRDVEPRDHAVFVASRPAQSDDGSGSAGR
jgi:hypothetical protein